MADELENEGCLLQVRNAYKTYDGINFVLRGLNMSVKKGTIYGLLGSSGCGKSTLLNSIIGLMQLDAGEICIPLLKKKDIGFMPQDLCLYQTMTIEEIFIYYGTLFKMDKEQLSNRIDFLYNFLQLPSKNRLINLLSGGEARRVSLAVSVMHNPKLMILDEPTVGVDPVLRQSIWEHLLQLCNENKMTIIITTHYIEETKQAHTVGLMREGVLLCEEPPISIITRLSCNSLEEAFLVLSKQQTVADPNQEENRVKIKKYNKVNSPLNKQDNSIYYSRFRAEVLKNMFGIIRNIPLVVYLIVLPIASCFLFNLGIGYQPESLSIGVVADELSFDPITDCEAHLKKSNLTCNLEYLSCQYLLEIKRTRLKLITYYNLNEAIEAIKKNDVWGVIHFPKNYTKNFEIRIEEGRFVSDEVIDNGLSNIYLDRSNRIMDELININLRSSFDVFIQNLFKKCEWGDRAGLIPISFQKPIYGVQNPTFRDYACPAMVTVILFSMPLVYGVVIIIEDKNSGAVGRSIAAGLTILEVILGHFIIQILLQIIQTCSTIFVMFYIYEFQFMKPLLSILLLFLQGVVGVSLAFLISIACSSLTLATNICTFCVLTSILLGGMIWPYEGIHPLLKPLSTIMPITLPVESLRNLTQKGWDITYTTVWLGYFTCICWIILFNLGVYLILRKTKGKAFLSK